VKEGAAEWRKVSGSLANVAGQERLPHQHPRLAVGHKRRHFVDCPARTDAPLLPLGKSVASMKAVRSCWARGPHEVHVILFRPHLLLLFAGLF